MIQKSYLFFILSILIFSCKKEDSKIEISTNIWIPIIKIDKGDKEATLHLIDPRPFTEYVIPPLNPDYFEILISENNKDFTFLKKLAITTDEVKIPNLQNDKAYYIKVSSHKGKQSELFSNAIMTIPSKKYEPQNYVDNIGFSIKRVFSSKSSSFITFHSDELESNALFYRQLNQTAHKMIEKNSGFASWSPNTDNFVYIKNIDIGYQRHNHQFKLYNTSNNEISTLIDINYKKYSAYNPQYSPNGDKIVFISSEGNSEKHKFDIWTYDLSSKEKSKITNFETKGFVINELNWVNHPDEIYLYGYFSSKSSNYNIHKLNLKDNSLVPIIESEWNDGKPVLSPDKKIIAFSSDRTGVQELWIYSLNSKEYKQITGEASHNFDHRYTNIQWLNNNEILLTLFENTVSKLMTVKLE